ncbi:MAG TPA: ATP-binding protein, partial [Nitrospirota bacterium]
MTLHQELDRRFDIIGNYLAHEIAESAGIKDLEAIDRVLQAAALDKEVNYVMVKSPDGEILASRWIAETRGGVHEYSFPIRTPKSPPPVQTTEPFGPATASAQGSEIGSLTIGVDLSLLDRKHDALLVRTTLAVAIAAVLAVALGLVFVRIFLQSSITPLLAGIREIGSGDLSHRISIHRRDEMAEIGRAFNTMAERLSDTLITKEHLETAVEQRTNALKVALEDRTRAQAAIADREERIRLLLDSAAEAIYGIDRNGNCTFCNPACFKMLGYQSEQDLLGKNMHDMIHHSKADGSPYPVERCPIFAAFRTGKGNHVSDEVFWKADGASIHVEYWSYPIIQGELLQGAVITFLDITERLKLEHQLLQSQKLESIGRLAGGIAHDFNNILAAIVGYGSILQMKMRQDDPSRPYADQILAATERAAGLTQSLLAFSRKQVINPKNIDLNASIRKVEKFLSRIIGEDITLTMTLSPEPLTIFADATQIEQILMNLATNARDAMPRGGSLLISTERIEYNAAQTLTHSFGETGRYAVLSVTDTGMGMNEQTQPKIFEPFFTTKEVGKGTGLGLAIVYGVVKQNNGQINVYSEVGKGTTFKIYLPLVLASAELEQAAVSLPLREGTETILLAEDDEAIRNL